MGGRNCFKAAAIHSNHFPQEITVNTVIGQSNVNLSRTNPLFRRRILDIHLKVACLAQQRDIQYVSSALSQCFTCLAKAQLTVVVGALRNAALLQLQGRFHSSSSKVTAAAKNSLRARAAAAQPLKTPTTAAAHQGASCCTYCTYSDGASLVENAL